MNQFKESLKVNHISQLLDNEILGVIENELNRLQSMCEISEYSKQIEERKQSLKYFFKDFDNNMRILETHTRFNLTNVTSISPSSYQIVLDRILSKKISEKLAKLYLDKQNSFFRTSTLYTDAIMSQIFDRQLCIVSLFESFDSKMEIVRNSKINKKNLSEHEHIV